ncbi:DUF1275 family protein [Mycobacterium intracellulare]|uniref:DUF1275 family protein n=1 Tax=Mycobacterium intracellulare TaxID=1767 RepID=UPI003AAFD92F
MLGEAALLVAATARTRWVKALLAAAACGLQNGMTSNFRGMAIRTTHFTGTMTDSGSCWAVAGAGSTRGRPPF